MGCFILRNFIFLGGKYTIKNGKEKSKIRKFVFLPFENKKLPIMKKLKLLLVLVAVTLTAISCDSKGDSQKHDQDQSTSSPKKAEKILVLYYSQTGTTRAVAQEISKRIGADIEEIVMVDPYEEDYDATIKRCLKEREQGFVPSIQPVKADISRYDVIFIGYPVWFGTYAPPVAAFLDSVDLSGKKVVPFCTFGSGGLESSIKDLEAAEPKATILPGYGVRAARMEAMPSEVARFLIAYGFMDGEYAPLDEFSESREVSKEEEAIFNAAVKGYKMLNAKAKTVASRSVPDGTEYLFTAVDKPRKKAKSKMPPAGEIQVYVLVADGEAPVFTKVVR